jgi:hypothetical protein
MACHSILVALGFRQAQDDTVEKAPQAESRADFAQDDSARSVVYHSFLYYRKLLKFDLSVCIARIQEK